MPLFRVPGSVFSKCDPKAFDKRFICSENMSLHKVTCGHVNLKFHNIMCALTFQR